MILGNASLRKVLGESICESAFLGDARKVYLCFFYREVCTIDPPMREGA